MPKRRSSRFPLTRYPGAAAAYSTRQLDRFYKGPALRVRRSNDNAEQDIGFSGGDLDEAALTAFVGVNSAFVTTWYDQSGNGRNATQATAANQPRIVNAGVVDKVNGRAGVFGLSVGTLMETTGFNILGDFSYFAVENIPVTSGEVLPIYHGNPGANGHGLSQTSTRRMLFGGVQILSDGASVVDVTTSRSAHRTAGAEQVTSHFVNGAPAALTPNNSNPNVNVVGSVTIVRTLGTGQLRVGEVIYYQTDQSANRAAIESNIMSYFGITA